MLLVDANVLLYAVNEDAPHHEKARNWLDEALGSDEPVGFAWVVLLAFLRLATNPSLFPHPLTPAQSTDVVEGWLGRPASLVLQPGERHLSLLRGLLAESGTAANLVNDAHLAALALEHGAEIVSFDRDFERFAGVRSRLPEPS
ncbi:MAG TPA: type II toxin-antitoxin system VapC family toxin [Gaiellaceae bacterium]|nr:type II toxin-antitoxin system VapC family toxin [Gaiellaceae bacterium]